MFRPTYEERVVYEGFREGVSGDVGPGTVTVEVGG